MVTVYCTMSNKFSYFYSILFKFLHFGIHYFSFVLTDTRAGIHQGIQYHFRFLKIYLTLFRTAKKEQLVISSFSISFSIQLKKL